MAITFPQFKSNNTAAASNTVSATFTNPIAAGSFIAVAAITDTGITTFTFGDGHADTATDSGLGLITDSTIGVKAKVVAFLAPASGTQTITLTTNVNFSFAEICIWEVAGITGPVFDKAIFGTTPSGTSATSGFTGTLSASNEAAIGYGLAATSGYNAQGSGWTLDVFTPNGFNDLTEHQVLSSNASIAATGTVAASSYTGVFCFTFMAGGGAASIPFINTDWPLPTRPSQIDQFSGWRQTRMIGQDKLPNRQQDWPNPTQPSRIDQSVLWSQTRMFGQDKLPVLQRDWPNPTQPWRLDQTWAWLQTRMIGQDRLPFRQQDWPNPTAPPAPGPSITWSQARMLGQDALPNRQQDWPNPTPPPPPGQTWSWRQTGMAGQDQLPNRQQDWPNPTQPTRVDQTWLQGFSNLLASIVVLYPHNQYDWPNPTAPSRLDQTWAWRQVGILGQDRLPNRQQDWPSPTQPPRIDQSWSWSQSRMAGQDVLPFRQQDWPLSGLHTLPRIDPTFVSGFTVLLEGSIIQVAPPFTNYDWPIPLGHQIQFQPAVLQPAQPWFLPGPVTILGGLVRGEVAYRLTPDDLRRLREHYERRDRRFRSEARESFGAVVADIAEAARDHVEAAIESAPVSQVASPATEAPIAAYIRPEESVFEQIQQDMHLAQAQDNTLRMYHEILAEIRRAWNEEDERDIEMLLLG